MKPDFESDSKGSCRNGAAFRRWSPPLPSDPSAACWTTSTSSNTDDCSSCSARWPARWRGRTCRRCRTGSQPRSCSRRPSCRPSAGPWSDPFDRARPIRRAELRARKIGVARRRQLSCCHHDHRPPDLANRPFFFSIKWNIKLDWQI